MTTVYPWQGKATRGGHEKIGPQHKLPHHERAFKCSLYTLLKEEKRDGCAVLRTLRKLFTEMQGMAYRPFFDATEIEELFSQDLKGYANERYKSPADLSTIEHWKDFANNRGVSPALLYRDFLREKGDSVTERLDMIKNWQTGIRTLTLIEDWLFHNPAEREKLSTMIDEHLST